MFGYPMFSIRKTTKYPCKEETLRMDGVKKSFCEYDRASVRCNKALDYKTFGSSLNCNAYIPHSWGIHERKKIPSIFVRFWVNETGYLSRVSHHHLHHYNHTIQGGRSWQPFGESKNGHKTFVRRVFAIFATNATFLPFIANFQI